MDRDDMIARIIDLQEEQIEMQRKISSLEAKIPNLRAIIREARAAGVDEVEERAIAALKSLFDAQVEELRAMLVPPVAAAKESDDICVVCREDPPECTIMPCGHICVCRECSVELLRAGIKKCPCCRGEISAIY